MARPRRKKRTWKRFVLAVLVGVASFALYQWATWPQAAALVGAPPATTAFMEDGRQEHGEVDWRWVPYGQIASTMKRAVLVAEDIDFFGHNGFALNEIRAAVRDTVTEGKPLRGASTLSQQLAKNLWLSPSRNPWRKVKEALLTASLERRLEKRRIFEIYLNVVEFGPGVYGVEAAAQQFYGTSASSLTRTQAARLAASLPNPTSWNAGTKSATAERRAQRIAAGMRQADWLRKVI